MTLFGIELSDSGRGIFLGTDEETTWHANVTRVSMGYWAGIDYSNRWSIEGPVLPSPEAAVDALHALVRDLAARLPK